MLERVFSYLRTLEGTLGSLVAMQTTGRVSYLLERFHGRYTPRSCYELCELACASTIVPLLLTQLLFYALSPAPCFSCQSPPTGTNTQLRTQAKQKQSLSLQK